MSVTNIRKGIFETNSSSVHVLSINKSADVKVPESFTFMSRGEFGWDRDIYTSPGSCGQYFYLILKNYAYDKAVAEYILTDEYNVLKETEGKYVYYKKGKSKIFPEINEKYLNEYKEIVTNILNDAGCYDVTFESDPEFSSSSVLDSGYIDHANMAYEFFEDLLNTPELLINFLFGNGTIETGNDNYAYPNGNPNADYTYIKGN